MSSTTSYWCYRCSRFVRVLSPESVTCPDCDSGFIEEIQNPPSRAVNVDGRRRRPALYMIDRNRRDSGQNLGSGIRGGRRNGGDRSPFNPVIVLRGQHDGDGSNNSESRGFELYYDDGGGSGLRRLPPSMSELLLGSGFDRLIDQLSQMEINGIGRYEQPAASKSAIESMPTIEIGEIHTSTESQSHCAVCKEEFELGCEAREMPCKHIYHSDCILPWLSIRNSCPVCRHELPSDPLSGAESVQPENGRIPGLNEEENVGLTIWRLPGGGLAVGRFSGGRRGGGGGNERELPVVYTEMDGGFNNGGLPRRVSWTANGRRGRERGSFGQMFRNMFGCFGGGRPRNEGSSSSSSSSSSDSRTGRGRPLHIFNTSSRRRRTWSMDVNGGFRMW